jgi:hypothetical protein
MTDEAATRLRAHTRRMGRLAAELEALRDRLAAIVAERRRTLEDIQDML